MTIEKELEAVYKMANALRMINLLKTALTVGIIAFTVLRVFYIIREKT